MSTHFIDITAAESHLKKECHAFEVSAWRDGEKFRASIRRNKFTEPVRVEGATPDEIVKKVLAVREAWRLAGFERMYLAVIAGKPIPSARQIAQKAHEEYMRRRELAMERAAAVHAN